MRQAIATPRFERDARKVSKEILTAFDEVFPQLCQYPTDPTLRVKKLVNVHPPVWRLRIGAYRLLYTFDAKYLFLIGLKHRKDAYRP